MDKIQEFNYANELLEVYGDTLTTKQREIMESYYIFNLTTQEIADNLSISKAGVSDALKVSLKHLENLEIIVGHLAYKKKNEALLARIEEITEDEKVLSLLKTEENNGI